MFLCIVVNLGFVNKSYGLYYILNSRIINRIFMMIFNIGVNCFIFYCVIKRFVDYIGVI